MEKLYIVIPANESENSKRRVEGWRFVMAALDQDGGSRLVIINDCSKDDTYRILTELAKDGTPLLPLTKETAAMAPPFSMVTDTPWKTGRITSSNRSSGSGGRPWGILTD